MTVPPITYNLVPIWGAGQWGPDEKQQYAVVCGEYEVGRKHPRTVGLAPWVVLQLKLFRAQQHPASDKVYPYHEDTSCKDFAKFRKKYISRYITLKHLRRSFTNEGYECGLTAEEEAAMAGHSIEVAQKYYLDWRAMEARKKLPADPLIGRRRKALRLKPDASLDAFTP